MPQKKKSPFTAKDFGIGHLPENTTRDVVTWLNDFLETVGEADDISQLSNIEAVGVIPVLDEHPDAFQVEIYHRYHGRVCYLPDGNASAHDLAQRVQEAAIKQGTSLFNVSGAYTRTCVNYRDIIAIHRADKEAVFLYFKEFFEPIAITFLSEDSCTQAISRFTRNLDSDWLNLKKDGVFAGKISAENGFPDDGNVLVPMQHVLNIGIESTRDPATSVVYVEINYPVEGGRDYKVYKLHTESAAEAKKVHAALHAKWEAWKTEHGLQEGAAALPSGLFSEVVRTAGQAPSNSIDIVIPKVQLGKPHRPKVKRQSVKPGTKADKLKS